MVNEPLTMFRVTRGEDEETVNMLGVLRLAVEVRDGVTDPGTVSVVEDV